MSLSSRDLGHFSACTQIQLVQLELEARLVDNAKLNGDKDFLSDCISTVFK